jgi:predicted nuclease of predicted toxin-antitoxin system
LRFLVDAQLPPRLAHRLAALGHEAAHVADLDLATATDHAIWGEALGRGAALMTKDRDFVTLRIAKIQARRSYGCALVIAIPKR